jgi:hypothetical protein
MQVEYFYSNDYAGFESGKFTYYYGYEETDPKDEDMWCFVVKENGKIIFKLTEKEIEEKLGKSNSRLEGVRDFLLGGIAIYELLR